MDLGIYHHCEPLARSNCKSSHSTINFSAPKRFVDLKSTSEATNDSLVTLTQNQTGNEIWLQPEFGELPLDRWLWRAASCRSDVVFVTCIISFFAWDVFFVNCGVFLVLVMPCLSFGGCYCYLRCFFCRVVFILFSVVFSLLLVIFWFFVVSVFFVVTTPSSFFKIHLCANGQEVYVEGYTAHCANVWGLIRIIVFFLGMNSPTVCLVMDIMASVHRAEKLALGNSTSRYFNFRSTPTNILTDQLIMRIEKLPQR